MTPLVTTHIDGHDASASRLRAAYTKLQAAVDVYQDLSEVAWLTAAEEQFAHNDFIAAVRAWKEYVVTETQSYRESNRQDSASDEAYISWQLQFAALVDEIDLDQISEVMSRFIALMEIEPNQLEKELSMAADDKMTTTLYNAKGTLLGEIEVSSVVVTGTTTYMTGSLRDDGMTEWFDEAKLADGRRCGVMFLFTAAEMASVTEDLSWSTSHIDRVVLDSDEDDFAPPAAGENLSHANLRNADLRNMSLRGADLRNADLRNTDLSDVDLRGADLTSADLSHAIMRGADLSGANLTEAYMFAAILRGANLCRANLADSHLTQADLFSANLSGANLCRAYMFEADLSGADLSRANLSGANLTGVNLRASNMRGSNLVDSKLTGTDLRNADMTGADLTGAKLCQANMSGANMTGATLVDTNLFSADLRGADLTDATRGGYLCQMFGSRHTVVVYEDRIMIGCVSKTLEEWRDDYKQVGEANGYTLAQIEEYRDLLELASAQMEEGQ